MRRHLRFFGLLMAAALLFALPACSAFDADSSKDDSLEEVRNQRAQWEERGIEDYQFSYARRTESAADQVGPFRVFVSEGAVDSVYASGERFQPRDGQTIFTIDGIYDFIIDALQQDPNTVSFDFLPSLNIPLYSGINYDSDDFGDEEIIEILPIETGSGGNTYLIVESEDAETSLQAAR